MICLEKPGKVGSIDKSGKHQGFDELCGSWKLY